MRKTVTMLAAAGLATGLGNAHAEVGDLTLTGNVGVASNYLFRGVTESDDDAAISGGLDLEHGSGFYLGTWTSSLGGGNSYELDFYAGYGGQVASFGYDLGVLHYAYPLDDDLDFTELYLDGSYDLAPAVLSAGVAYTVDADDGDAEDDLYYYAGVDFELPQGFGLGFLVGHYDPDASGAEDYTHYQVSVTQGDFMLAVDQHDMDDDDDPRVWASWSKSFDLM